MKYYVQFSDGKDDVDELKKEKIVDNLWNDYKKNIPHGASATQLKETKRAFYAGCSCVFSLIMNDISELEENEAEKAMDSILEELHDFVEKVKFGKA